MKWILSLGLFLLTSCGFPEAPSVSSVDTQVTQDWVLIQREGADLDEPHAIAADSAGNVYVGGKVRTGAGITTEDFATIKISASGSLIWKTTFNGTGGDSDEVNALAVDSSGNVYVSGRCRSGVVADTNDFCTIKYNSAGTQQWSSTLNPSAFSDTPRALALDASANVYVTGFCRTGALASSQNFCTVAYNGSTGTELWSVTAKDGGAAGLDEANAIAVRDGFVYVTGRGTTGVGTGTDYMTVKYNATSGAEVWTATFNGGGSATDIANDIAVDASGNVYVTGESASAANGDDYVTVKYNSSGTEQWSTSYNGPGNSTDEGRSIALGPDGSVYVTGNSQSGVAGTTADYATIKYDAATGTQVWASRFNGAGNSTDAAQVVRVDSKDRVYVSGESTGSGTGLDLVTLKYDGADGTQLWSQSYNNSANNGNDEDAFMVIREASPTTLYVTGETAISGTDDDWVVIQYSQPGLCGF